MDNSITLQLSLTIGREQLPLIRRLMALAAESAEDIGDLPEDGVRCQECPDRAPVSPEEAAKAITDANPEAKELLDIFDAEPVSVWDDDSYLAAVTPCIQENRDKATKFLALFAQGNGIKPAGARLKMRDVPTSLRGDFVVALYNYFGKQYDGAA